MARVNSRARRRPGTAVGVPTTLTTFGLVRSLSSLISAAMVAMSGPFSSSGARQSTRQARLQRGKVALQVEDDVEVALGVDVIDGLEHAVGARDVIWARQDGFAAGLAYGRDDLLRIGGHHDATDVGRHGPPPDVHDHRRAGYIGQRLAGQPRRVHPGRNDDEGALHGPFGAGGDNSSRG